MAFPRTPKTPLPRQGRPAAPPPSACASVICAASHVPVLEAAGPALASILHGITGQGRAGMVSMMYQAYQNHMDLTSPWRTGAAAGLKYLNLVPQGVSDRLFGRLAASLELISRPSLTYHRPPFGLNTVLVG